MGRVFELDNGDLIDLDFIYEISVTEADGDYYVFFRDGKHKQFSTTEGEELHQNKGDLVDAWRAHMDGVVNVEVKQSVGEIPLDYKGEPKITNDMKAVCIGEFSWIEDDPYYDENGELHAEHVRTNEVPWDLCKKIYKQMGLVAMESVK